MVDSRQILYVGTCMNRTWRDWRVSWKSLAAHPGTRSGAETGGLRKDLLDPVEPQNRWLLTQWVVPICTRITNARRWS